MKSKNEMMRDEIISNLNNPRLVEKLYRDNKPVFRKEFNVVYPTIHESEVARVWYERLNFEGREISGGNRGDLIFVMAAALIAVLIAQIPEFTGISPDYFYPRNLAFITLPLMAAYFARKHQLTVNNMVGVAAALLVSVIYMNLLPDNSKSDTLILACMHIPVFLWTLVGYSFSGAEMHNYRRRLEFLKFNGDLVVMTTIMLIAGGILTAVTIGLFELIDLRIEDFYFQYIVISGLAAAPLIGTYLVDNNPWLVNKISPVIAKMFTPLVLIMLVIYLCAVIFTGKDPYNDREFLMIFNLLLIGVMAIILFSVTEIADNPERKSGLFLLLALSAVTIVVNGIALSAIVFRISEWGITPNRIAVLGGNLLILTNLLVVAFRLFKTIRNQSEPENIEKSIALFLPVYGVWTMVVTFIFPLLFGFK